MDSVCVVHLVRACNGIKPFERFLASYRAHPAGYPHDLMFIFKGFRNQDDLAPYFQLLGDVAYRSLHVGEGGYDIVPYFKAAREVNHDNMMFLNSFSEILYDGWLAKMASPLQEQGVGLVGATGSWGGQSALFHSRRKRVLRVWPWYERLARTLLTWWQSRNFPLFPNPHIRSNAFMLNRQLFLSLNRPSVQWKGDVYRFESGKQSMTQQIMALGLRPLVADCHGDTYEIQAWWDSDTFWQRDQERLLIADNQTRDYQYGSYARRQLLSRFAWGQHSKPVPYFDAPPTGRKYLRRRLLDLLIKRPGVRPPVASGQNSHRKDSATTFDQNR